MMKPSPTHNAIGANTGGHRVQTGSQDGRKANALKFFGKRSTTTRTRASRRRDNHGLNPVLLQLGGDLSTNSAHSVQTAQITDCDIKGIE
jgi:hypothetical protein